MLSCFLSSDDLNISVFYPLSPLLFCIVIHNYAIPPFIVPYGPKNGGNIKYSGGDDGT